MTYHPTEYLNLEIACRASSPKYMSWICLFVALLAARDYSYRRTSRFDFLRRVDSIQAANAKVERKALSNGYLAVWNKRRGQMWEDLLTEYLEAIYGDAFSKRVRIMNETFHLDYALSAQYNVILEAKNIAGCTLMEYYKNLRGSVVSALKYSSILDNDSITYRGKVFVGIVIIFFPHRFAKAAIRLWEAKSAIPEVRLVEGTLQNLNGLL